MKLAMAEDLLMEFIESPADPATGFAALSSLKTALEDALVQIMTGVVQVTGIMRST